MIGSAAPGGAARPSPFSARPGAHGFRRRGAAVPDDYGVSWDEWAQAGIAEIDWPVFSAMASSVSIPRSAHIGVRFGMI